MILLRTSALIVSSLLLTSCMTLGPNYKAPETKLAEAWSEANPSWEAGVTPDNWWTLFNDEKLTALIQKAEAQNLTAQAAMARVRVSRELLGISRSAYYPTVDGNASYTRRQTSETLANQGPEVKELRNPTNTWQAGVDAAWELDIFGRVKRSVEASRAELEAQESVLSDVMISLQGEVALSYMQLRGAQQQLAAVEENLGAQQETLDLTRKRLEAGLATALDVARGEAQVATTQSQVPPLQEDVRRAIHRIGVLVGEEPGALKAELMARGPIPTIVGAPRFTPPADLLRRRYDIREAERLLAAETARIGMRKAELYPRFTISGNLGLQTEDLSDTGIQPSKVWSIGPGVTVPLFNAGALRAQVRAQDARAEAALAEYRQTVLLAMEETENALASFTQEQLRRDALRSAVEANQRSFKLSEELFMKGLIDFLDVLDAQRTLLASQSSLAASEALVAQNLVTVWKSLGGAWEEPKPVEESK